MRGSNGRQEEGLELYKPSLYGGADLCFLQGAYGVVRLAYNESEDRHYVSVGKWWGHGPNKTLQAWGGGGRNCWTEDRSASVESECSVSKGLCRELILGGFLGVLRWCHQGYIWLC